MISAEVEKWESGICTSYSKRLNELKLRHIHDRRKRVDLINAYKMSRLTTVSVIWLQPIFHLEITSGSRVHSWKLQQVILSTSVRQHLYVYGPDAHILTSEKTVPIPLVYTRPQIFKYLPRWVCRVGVPNLCGDVFILVTLYWQWQRSVSPVTMEQFCWQGTAKQVAKFTCLASKLSVIDSIRYGYQLNRELRTQVSDTSKGFILELEQPWKTAKIPQIFSDFYYE